MSFDSVEQILDFAIAEEEAAARFYADLAARAPLPAMREALQSFAHEEEGHREKLRSVRDGRLTLSARERVQDLRIADYLVDLVPRADLDYASILIVAMKKEKAAFRLYSDLAARVDGELRELFLGLAQEEAKHKLRFEVEYDQHVLTEN